MATLTNLDLLKNDLNALLVRILSLGKTDEEAGRYNYFKEKLEEHKIDKEIAYGFG